MLLKFIFPVLVIVYWKLSENFKLEILYWKLSKNFIEIHISSTSDDCVLEIIRKFLLKIHISNTSDWEFQSHFTP